MSEVTVSSADVQAYREKIQEIIERNRGKKEPIKSDRKPFVDAWLSLVRVTGITDEAADYFFDGAKIAEAEPLYRLASESDVARTYQAFLRAKRAQKNSNGCTFRALLNLLALELIDPHVPNPLDSIARKLSSCVYGKRGKQMEQIIRKQIVRPLANDPISAEADMQRASAVTLLKFMRPLLESIIAGRDKRKANLVAAQNLLGWLEEHAAETSQNDESVVGSEQVPADVPKTLAPSDSPEQGESVGETDTQESPDSQETLKTLKEHETQPETETENEASPETFDVNAAASDVVADSSDEAQANVDFTVQQSEEPRASGKVPNDANPVAESETSMKEPKKTDSSSQKKIDEYKKRLQKAKKEKESAEDQLGQQKLLTGTARREAAEYRDRLHSLTANYADLQRRLESLEVENESLKEDLAAAEEMLTMREEHNAHQADVSQQRMLRDLRFEYQDYMDAIELDMTEDLGENMRDQLGNVFEILKANGMEL